AWIAGAVFGPVVALLALGALAFFWLKGRKAGQGQDRTVMAENMKGNEGGMMGGNGGYNYAHSTPSNLLRPELGHAPQSWQTQTVGSPTPMSMPELETYQRPVEVA
ncbi:hypothetical protein N0V85_006002, partial [Neurospora sp. IMI 360204]